MDELVKELNYDFHMQLHYIQTLLERLSSHHGDFLQIFKSFKINYFIFQIVV